MEVFQIIAEILKYVLPAGLVLLAIRSINSYYQEQQKAESERMLRAETLRQHLPLKIAAYERSVLFLERISPEHLLLRMNGSGKPAALFYSELLDEVRSEFEHNLVQQLYVSNEGWSALLRAKEETLGLIHRAFRAMPEDADGIALARQVFAFHSEAADFPSQKAIFVLKKDISVLFRLP
jgi:hypothetical protein